MRAAILALALTGCARPELVKAEAAAQTAAAAETGAASSTSTQVRAADEVQAASTATVAVKRGPRRVAISVTPALDGGAPTFKLELDDGADEISAGATGAADAEADVDAGAIAAADAGASSSADAGAEAKVEPPRPPFWSLSRLVTLIAGIAVAIAIGFAILKLRPRL